MAVDAVYPGAGPFSLAMPFVLLATLFGRWQAGRDRADLWPVVSELVTNAAKHARPGGRRGHIAVSLAACDTLVLKVSDDGIGSVVAESAQRGSGVDLIGSLVASHGGAVARDANGTGTTVTVTMPARPRAGI